MLVFMRVSVGFVRLSGVQSLNADVSDELWVLSTTRMEWTLSIAAGESPSAREGHTMATVEAHHGNAVYLVGGSFDFDGSKFGVSRASLIATIQYFLPCQRLPSLEMTNHLIA